MQLDLRMLSQPVWAHDQGTAEDWVGVVGGVIIETRRILRESLAL